jgi:formylmethanofuran dehydrogenase subunit C
MSSLVFRLREAPPERLDLSDLIPSKIGKLSAAEIERLRIGTSRMGLVVGDIFDVEAGDVGNIRFDGGSQRFDCLGAGLDAGQIFVDGDVGQRVGMGMTLGEISIVGHAGPFAGTAASGGIVRISGSAGEAAGGGVHGAMHGLNGAVLVIEGDAGPRLGDRMRRGLILVGGNAADYAGSRMFAGTIVAQSIGDNPGYAMRRGTIITAAHGALLPTFVPLGPQRRIVTRLLRRAVAGIRAQSADIIADETVGFAGDLATLGKGEILRPVN